MTRDQACKLLGVPASATPAHAHSRYRALSKTYHPDRPGGSAEMQQQLNEAYSVLCKPVPNTQLRAEIQRKIAMCRVRLDTAKARASFMADGDPRIGLMIGPLEQEFHQLHEQLDALS